MPIKDAPLGSVSSQLPCKTFLRTFLALDIADETLLTLLPPTDVYSSPGFDAGFCLVQRTLLCYFGCIKTREMCRRMLAFIADGLCAQLPRNLLVR
jgi:hypothetical protein